MDFSEWWKNSWNNVRLKFKNLIFFKYFGLIDSPWDRDRLERWSRGKRELGNPESELGWLESRRSRTSRTDCWRNRPPLNTNNNWIKTCFDKHCGISYLSAHNCSQNVLFFVMIFDWINKQPFYITSLEENSSRK